MPCRKPAGFTEGIDMTEVLVLSAAEAAKALRERPERIKEKLEAGEIPAYREGREWKIPLSLLKASIEHKALEEAKARRQVRNEKNEMESK